MSDAKGQHEPSMEEILASIRRIIAEDNETPPAPEEKKAAAAPPPPDDILELTEIAEEEGEAAPEPVADSPPIVALDEPKFAIDPEPDLRLPESLGPLAEDEDRLLSATSAAASVAALSQLVGRGGLDRTGELALGAVNRTLEDMVREMLRPLLKGWLDDNLPLLVERLVRDEIARLVREAQGR
jgi:cell pole-organizing protein PopZ